jgi:hypothetical protein
MGYLVKVFGQRAMRAVAVDDDHLGDLLNDVTRSSFVGTTVVSAQA